MSVKTRKQKIEVLIPQITILLRKNGTATQFDMPGSQHRRLSQSKYHVTVGKVQAGEVEGIKYFEYPVSCLHKNDRGSENCKGNSKDTVCYHGLAALKKRAEPDVKITYADSFLDAIRLLSFGGKLIKVVSKQNNGSVWGVAK